MCHFVDLLKGIPYDTPYSTKMLRDSKYIALDLLYVVFELPGFTVSIGHADHDGSSPGQREEAAKGDEKSQALPAIWQNILNKAQGCVAASCKED